MKNEIPGNAMSQTHGAPIQHDGSSNGQILVDQADMSSSMIIDNATLVAVHDSAQGEAIKKSDDISTRVRLIEETIAHEETDAEIESLLCDEAISDSESSLVQYVICPFQFSNAIAFPPDDPLLMQTILHDSSSTSLMKPFDQTRFGPPSVIPEFNYDSSQIKCPSDVITNFRTSKISDVGFLSGIDGMPIFNQPLNRKRKLTQASSDRTLDESVSNVPEVINDSASSSLQNVKSETQAKSRRKEIEHDRYSERLQRKKELHAKRKRTITQPCYTWNSLQLGTTTGTAALNNFLKDRRNESFPLEFTSLQSLQIINSLRPKTYLPPLESGLNEVLFLDPRTSELECDLDVSLNDLLTIENDSSNSTEEENRIEDKMVWRDLEMASHSRSVGTSCIALRGRSDSKEISINQRYAKDEGDSHNDGDEEDDDDDTTVNRTALETISLPTNELLSLYQTMLAQDINDGTEFRREASLIPAWACADRLQSMENDASRLVFWQKTIEREGQELGLLTAVQKNEVAADDGCGDVVTGIAWEDTLRCMGYS